MPKKITNEEFLKRVPEDFQALETYRGSHIKIKFKHLKCGNEFYIQPTKLLKGNSSCPMCCKNKRLTTEEMKEKIKDATRGEYELIGEFVNTRTKVKIRHNKCGFIWETRSSDILRGHGCFRCYGTKKITYSQLEKIVEEKTGGEFEVAQDTANYRQQICIKHKKCGLIRKTSLANFMRNPKGCYHCSSTKTQEEFESEVQELGNSEYSVLGEYFNNSTQIKMRHNICGNEYAVKPIDFLTGSRCPVCSAKFSNKEKELLSFVQSIYKGEILSNDRHLGFELDIYLPEKKVALEFNGNYWHSLAQKDKKYHYNKSRRCEDNGIRLIHIFEYEWDNPRQRPILENIIKNALGINQEKIYARNCSIEVRESKKMRQFFDNNNIQGFRGGKFAICLVYKEEVVMAYMMGSCYLGGKGKYEWEVIRGATKLGINVIGGASKIWSYFLKTYNPNNCVYYIDYNYFNGSSLPYLGLKYVGCRESFKNYWQNLKTVKNREPQRNKEIQELYKTGEVIPIYNAGTKTYVYEKE